MLSVTFHVWYDRNTLFVEWSAELGTTGSPVHQYLGELFHKWPGVDRVEVRRYACILTCVPRVLPMDHIAKTLRRILVVDPALRTYIEKAFGQPDDYAVLVDDCPPGGDEEVTSLQRRLGAAAEVLESWTEMSGHPQYEALRRAISTPT